MTEAPLWVTAPAPPPHPTLAQKVPLARRVAEVYRAELSLLRPNKAENNNLPSCPGWNSTKLPKMELSGDKGISAFTNAFGALR